MRLLRCLELSSLERAELPQRPLVSSRISQQFSFSYVANSHFTIERGHRAEVARMYVCMSSTRWARRDSTQAYKNTLQTIMPKVHGSARWQVCEANPANTVQHPLFRSTKAQPYSHALASSIPPPTQYATSERGTEVDGEGSRVGASQEADRFCDPSSFSTGPQKCARRLVRRNSVITSHIRDGACPSHPRDALSQP